MQRRQLLTALPAAAFAASAAPAPAARDSGPGRVVVRRPGTHLKIGLNAYSFNRPLMAGKMNLNEVIDYCAANNIDGVDLTGYYFPGYPTPPDDSFLYALKRRAFLNGVAITGTGVRNDFTLADASSRRGHIALVKDWVDVAAKLGSDMVRVFSGPQAPKGASFDDVLKYMVPCFQECAYYGSKHGVIVGLQHHDDFLKTADETIRVVNEVGSDWFSVILDVGSVRQGDPYAEIEKLVPYAGNWQIKEHVWYGDKQTPIDLPRIKKIIDKYGYRGFTPIEALGNGDPATIVTAFLTQVRKAFEG